MRNSLHRVYVAHGYKQGVREMKYLSVCSGIEAASKAWEPIGWEPVAFSEIEPFPAAVLKHHWPKVQNLGDMTKYEQWNIQSGTIDLLVGGTPCQSFSVAGLRQGLKDPRGNLMLTYLAIAERLKPRWLVWENVPGVLSSNGGKDFGSFLGALGELGYEWAYRVLDAQWFGVAQRRRRVFVVAHLGKGNLAAKVLFESESVRRNPAPSRETRQGVATNVEAGFGVSPTITQCKGSRGGCSSKAISEITAVQQATAFRMQAFGEYSDDGSASTMKARDYKDATDLVASPIVIDRAAFNQGQNAQYKPHIAHSETMDSLVARGPHAIAFQTSELRLTGKLTEKSVCPTLKANTKAGDTEVKVVLYENHPNDSRVTGPHDVAPSCVSRYGTGGGNVPLVQEAIPFRDPSPTLTSKMQGQAGWAPYNEDAHLVGAVAVGCFKSGQGANARSIGYSETLSPTLSSAAGGNTVPAVAVDIYNQAVGVKSQTLRSGASSIEHSGGVINPADRMAVRRLTPRECERLQGFPDDHTLIPWRNKPADQCPDGPRYKALGNSMAVPCMAWIGKRIDAVERNMK
jgi:DNA (cytosine-5)-methyltransferase 1